ncbi:TadE family type IV pilus minor pilin [Microbacterium sp. VKM Ac-2870]|uniref:TadE family type IV pilus minor pilin n=1 Tax=Microbacterium sp. VKM Ac-2870 TaxID=2783825 RepID=UPI001E5850BB|nr:TadE family type IV pilus minor pilin [Microbacterium sp. VKM Ac-2870]
MRWRDDGGSATAEFAVIVPAVVLLIALTVGALGALGRQVRLEQAVAQAARLAARGEPDRAAQIVDAISGGRVDGVGADGDLVCVAASASVSIAVPLPDLHARSCALDGGR